MKERLQRDALLPGSLDLDVVSETLVSRRVLLILGPEPAAVNIKKPGYLAGAVRQMVEWSNGERNSIYLLACNK